ncbi:cysteine desulfurase [Salinisphaera sp. PC39]|uniref:cysteine desulfurase family protein n=1 Tax=Salinisphaera sp. PC39 TaxID=1304156 RepID=UPI00333F0209
MDAIYLDNAASAPLDPAVREAMLPYLAGVANPASGHGPGRRAGAAVETARERVAALIGAAPDEIVWTSGATEADNLAIAGPAAFAGGPGHIVTTAIEHKAVLDPVRRLARAGWRVTELGVDAGGRVDPAELAAALADDTVLVSVMHVNNETGTIQDLAAIGEHVRAHGAVFHVDAAQSLGKLPLSADAVGADLISLSAHKLHGPQGVGALYVRRRPRARLAPILHGGGHEQGLRPGTLPVHQVVGMGAACALAGERMAAERAAIARRRDRLWTRLAGLGGVRRHGDADHTVSGILNVGVAGVHGEALLAGLTLGEPALAVSSGAACSDARAGSSYVLRAMGLTPVQAAASLRFSLGRFTTDDDIERAADRVIEEVTRLRALAPSAADPDAIAGAA